MSIVRTNNDLEREAELYKLRRERDALAKFKAYVHARLDAAGVPTDPESPHKAEGCRIGGRLDVLIGERDALRKRVKRLEWVEASEQGMADRLRTLANEEGEIDALRERLRLAEAVCEAAKEMDCDPKRGGPAPWWIAERKFRAALAAWAAAAKPACPICGCTDHADPLPGTVGRRCVKCCNV